MVHVTQAVILCGGLGTRMGELTKDVPKPMLSIQGKPVLEHTIELLKSCGITDVIFAARYKADVISDHFGNGSAWGMQMSTSVEDEPLGTAGPLTLIKDQLQDQFLVLYGDEFIDFDLKAMLDEHSRVQPLITILTRPSTHPWDAHLIQAEKDGRITEFVKEREPGRHYRNLGNGAIYVMSRDVLKYIPEHKKSGFSEDVFIPALKAGEHLHSWTLTQGYIKDLASPDRLLLVEKYLADKAEIERARVERKPIKAVFLDRDGVINKDTDQLRDPQMLEILPGAPQAIKAFNDLGIATVIVTNQPVVARGLCGMEMVDHIHELIKMHLAEHGATLDAVYVCPHHQDTHHGEGVVALRRDCECRKPKAGMLLKAKDDLGLDLSECVMIGDSSTDIEAGQRAGLRTVLLNTGAGRVKQDVVPDFQFNTLLEAAQAISRGELQ
jgi:mannose-1-phosphate guanylyltransferase / phosphomannomutase